MKSNKKVFLLKDSILSSKIFKFSLNFSNDVATLCEKNNDSFWTLKNTKHTIIGSKSFHYNDYFSSTSTTSRYTDWYFPKLSKGLDLIPLYLKDVAQVEEYKKNTKTNNIFKFKLTNKKRDTSSIGITKNVNYSNYIPNVLKKNTSMGEDTSIYFNYTPHKDRGTSSAEIKT
tara:strand:+ start:671 stop:1186 length:516 start_codon:yes stop_codon:yes gene_type:complete